MQQQLRTIYRPPLCRFAFRANSSTCISNKRTSPSAFTEKFTGRFFATSICLYKSSWKAKNIAATSYSVESISRVRLGINYTGSNQWNTSFQRKIKIKNSPEQLVEHLVVMPPYLLLPTIRNLFARQELRSSDPTTRRKGTKNRAIR